MHKIFVGGLFIFLSSTLVFPMAELATKRLFQACKDYDVEVASAALELGAEVNNYDSKGFTPLLYACKFNYSLNIPSFLITRALDRQQQLVALLLNNGANINQESRDGAYTSLWMAVHGINPSIQLYNNNLVKMLECHKAKDERIVDLAKKRKEFLKESALTPYLQSPISWLELITLFKSFS